MNPARVKGYDKISRKWNPLLINNENISLPETAKGTRLESNWNPTGTRQEPEQGQESRNTVCGMWYVAHTHVQVISGESFDSVLSALLLLQPGDEAVTREARLHTVLGLFRMSVRISLFLSFAKREIPLLSVPYINSSTKSFKLSEVY